MKIKLKLAAVLLCLVYILSQTPAEKNPALAKEETSENQPMRAVWIATNYGLDFPKNKTTDPSSLKAELDNLIKSAKDMNFNTVFFQARPSGDAFYKSDIFPWSAYLSGEEGKAPDNGFDPLEYLTKICRENNIKIHAWINPYRLPNKKSSSPLSVDALHPKWVINCGDKKYLNPGIPEVNDFVAQGAGEIAKNYDVDGIQIDDYFYPEGNFPDDWSYSEYGKDFKDKASWRRENINSLFKKINAAVKKENKNILFGISPQGIWANAENISSGSETNGKEAYFSAYADTKKWVEDEMADYIIPQIYWNIGYSGADFKIIANWWNSVAKNSKTKLYLGLAAYKASDCTDPESVWYKQNGATELEKQATLAFALENVSGTAIYRLESLEKSEFLKASIKKINKGEIPVFYDLFDCSWAEESVEFLYKKGIINGMGDGSFGCRQNVSRGQFALMLSRMTGKNADFKENFDDVEKGSYYYNGIGSLKALGLISGISENKFNPQGEISRQDMAVMAYRILKSENLISSAKENKSFSDSADISDYAKEAVFAFCEKNILSGYENGEFKPKGKATRAECAVFLRRIFDIMSNTLEKFEN